MDHDPNRLAFDSNKKSMAMKLILLRSALLLIALGVSVASAQTNVAPTVVIVSANMRPGTTLMDVIYRVNDPDDATVKVRALAFKDGVRSFAHVIRPATFVEGTGSLIGETIAANVNHAPAWDVGADWNIDLGQAKFEILAMDGRGLLSFDWITIPAAGGYPQTTVSTNTPSSTEVMNALYWQFASGDPGLTLTNATLYGNSNSVEFNGVDIASGTSYTPWSTPYVLKSMNLAVADMRDLAPAMAARAGPLASGWLAANRPYSGFTVMSARSWGHDEHGAVSSNYVAAISGPRDISEGPTHGLAVTWNGGVLAWGGIGENYGQTSVPTGLSRVVAVAAGTWHSLALKNDGTVVGWGRNDYGQASPPSGLGGIIAIAAGDYHSMALRGDGTLVPWGRNNVGQLNVPAGLTGVVAISAAINHNLALKSDGTVVGWGKNDFGQATPPLGLSNVTAISAGGAHSLALKDDGTVVGWGLNDYGQATPPAGLSNVTAISVGALHSLALTSNRSVVAWGSGRGVGLTTVPAGVTNVVAIRAAGWANVVLMAKGL